MIIDYSFTFRNNSIFLDVYVNEKIAQMAFYIYCDNNKVYTRWYENKFSYDFKIDEINYKNDYHFVIFIKIGENIYSTKTPKINPYELTTDLNFNIEEINNLKTSNEIELFLKEASLINNLTIKSILNNLIYNDYEIKNLTFTDYIFIQHILNQLNISENWYQTIGSLGIINPSIMKKILNLVDEWYINNKISTFTKNFILALDYISHGNHEKAYEMFHSVQIPKEYYFSSYFKGLLTYSNNINPINKFPYQVLEIKENTQNNFIFCFSCNKIYFDKFFLTTLHSLINCFEKFDIAIALINFNEKELLEFKALIHKYELEYHINFSYMIISTEFHEKTLSACARFLISNQLMKNKNINLLVVDLDIYFTKNSIDILQKIIKKNNIGLSLKGNDKKLIPWVAIAAGASYFPAKVSSNIFLKIISDYINFSYNDSYNWYLDQNALFYGFKNHQINFPLESINNIHNFTSSILEKNNHIDLLKWKRGLTKQYSLNN